MKQITFKSALMRTMAVILFTFGTLSASAQYYMNIQKKDGTKINYYVTDIDSVWFTSSTVSGREYVDLGLSVKWATCNVGATKPEEYGDYFAWGETEPRYEAGYSKENPQTHWKDEKTDGYSFSTYKWCNGSYNTLTKYCINSEEGNNGFTDNKTTLDPEDDVAHVQWGGTWRMPTWAEQYELCSNCTWTQTTLNGVNGFKVTSKKEGYTDRFIFLPSAGYRYGAERGNVGSYGYYWSSSLGNPDHRGCAYELYFYSSIKDIYNASRAYGLSVRPVCP